MATLNIKNLPDRLHRKLRERAKREHRSVAQEVIHLLTAAVEAPTPLSILALRGLGRDALARARAEALLSRSPRGMYAPRIRRMLDTLP